jgi:hypothetical protein
VNDDTEAIARFLAQAASDRWERFLKSLGVGERRARETEAFRVFFEQNVRTMLTGNLSEAEQAAAWVSLHADEVAVRWCALRILYAQWIHDDREW